MPTTDEAGVTATPDSRGERKLLRDQAYEELKGRLLDEVYPPGSFLSERLLAEELGYGKAPIRQAVQRLQTDGFVSISPQQGIVVKTLSVDDMLDYFEMRVALERYVVYRLAGKLSTPQVAELTAFLEVQERQLTASLLPARNMALLNVGFHKMLCDFLGNKQIIRVMEHQHDMLYRVVKRIYKRHPERERRSLGEHTGVAEAIIKGDADRAAELMEAHIEVSKKLLVRV